ncbi:Leucine rich repeat containing protein BspA family protein [Entamoeba marina]
MASSIKKLTLNKCHMLQISKNFTYKQDFVNMVCINTKFKDILDAFYFNPIPVTNKVLFRNMKEQWLYSTEDYIIDGVEKYVVLYSVSYEEKQRNHKPNYRFKRIIYSEEDRDIYKEHIPKECNMLGDYCFEESTIETIIIPLNILSLGDGCFYGCSEIKQITLPHSIRSLPDYCFNLCTALTQINLSNIIEIGNGCFGSCGSLSSLTLSKDLEMIGFGCFNGCSSLIDICISDTIETLNCHVPYFISLLLEKCCVSCSNIKFTKEDVERYGFNIPPQSNMLDGYCFNNNADLKTIEIPSSITTFGNGCFYNCTSLISIKLPSLITHLPDYTFRYCKSLCELDCRYVTSIGNCCFSYCNSLTAITFSSNLKQTENGCFDNCTALQQITPTTINPT